MILLPTSTYVASLVGVPPRMLVKPPSRTVLRQILLLCRDVPRSAAFYERALDLPVRACTDAYAELDVASDTTLALQRFDFEAHLAHAYSPIIHFHVSDVNARVNAALELGATLDGSIKYEPHGVVACVRSPDGVTIGFYEPHA